MSCFCGRTKRPLEEVPLTCHVFEQTDDQKTLKQKMFFSIALLLMFSQVENVLWCIRKVFLLLELQHVQDMRYPVRHQIGPIRRFQSGERAFISIRPLP